MTRRTAWGVVFGAATATAVAMELWAAFDGDPDTVPWTEYLVKLPWWVLVPAALTLSIWLPIHLVLAKRRYERGEENPKGTT